MKQKYGKQLGKRPEGIKVIHHNQSPSNCASCNNSGSSSGISVTSL